VFLNRFKKCAQAGGLLRIGSPMLLAQAPNSKAFMVAKHTANHPDPLQIVRKKIIAMGFPAGGLGGGNTAGIITVSIEKPEAPEARCIGNGLQIKAKDWGHAPNYR
jgi:hypothetical protein